MKGGNKGFYNCVLMCFCSVLEMRVKSSMNWVDPEKFVDLYLAGRSKRTFATYNMQLTGSLKSSQSLKIKVKVNLNAILRKFVTS